MKIVHISSSDFRGGAARAAYRLHQGLRALGQNSSMFVANRETADPHVMAFQPITSLPGRLLRMLRREYLRRTFERQSAKRSPEAEVFTDDRNEYGAEVTDQLPPGDILHLHWVAGLAHYKLFFPVATRRAPVVWTLHDMNPFTGGCHYDEGCGRYRNRCGACPQLESSKETDFSTGVWARKQAAYRSIRPGRLHLVAPSRWLAAAAKRSALFSQLPISVIPNGLDVEALAPRDRRFARQVLGLPPDKRIILCVADWLDNRRKGVKFLVQALVTLKDHGDLLVVTIGRGTGLTDVPLPHASLGYVHDERLLSLAYSAADVFVCPTLQDNLPNTILESLACGVPVVGFNVGGVPDMVRDGETGLLVEARDAEGLGKAIAELLGNPERRRVMSENCRRIAVEEYSLVIQARRYVELYERVLASN